MGTDCQLKSMNTFVFSDVFQSFIIGEVYKLEGVFI